MIEVGSTSAQKGHRLMPRSPLVGAVARGLVDRIRHGEFRSGDRLPTIRQLAEQQKVSYSTVQLAVAHLEAMGLVERIQGSGTYVRQIKSAPPVATDRESVAEATTWTSMFLDTRFHLAGEFNAELIAQCQTQGMFNLCVSSSPGIMMRHLNHLRMQWQDNPPQAVVLNMVEKPRDEFVRSVLPVHTRVISVFRSAESSPPGWHTVNPDYTAAFRMGAQHLIELGHRRIGLITKRRIIASNWIHTERKAWMLETRQITGAGQALREAGLDHGLSIHYNQPVKSDPSGIPVDAVNVQRMVDWLSAPNRPTAILCDDFRMPGVRVAARRLGLAIPDDLYLMPVGAMCLHEGGGHAAVDLCQKSMAQQVASLIDATHNELGGAARHVLVPPRLIESVN